MICAWDAFLVLLPQNMRREVDKLGRDGLEEVRLRQGKPVELVISGKSIVLSLSASEGDLKFVINTASRYSPWAASTICQGYLTAKGGHRIGVCGECVVQGGQITGIRSAQSLCIRVARSFSGIAKYAPNSGSLLILGPPGSGKTTLLRDAIRLRSEGGHAVSVVDERGELFPLGASFPMGIRTDVITGCSKRQGVDMTVKTMRPQCVAVDEITTEDDCQALLDAGWCGVDLLATAHATDCHDLYRRRIYQPIVKSGLFQQVLVLRRDKSWRLERIEKCI